MLKEELRNLDVVFAKCGKQRKRVSATNSIDMLRVFDGEVLDQVIEPTKHRIVQRIWLLRDIVRSKSCGHRVYVIYPNPCRKMRFVGVKECFHPILHA